MKKQLFLSLLVSISYLHAMENQNFDQKINEGAKNIHSLQEEVSTLYVQAVALEQTICHSIKGFEKFELLKKLGLENTDNTRRSIEASLIIAQSENQFNDEGKLLLCRDLGAYTARLNHKKVILKQAVTQLRAIQSNKDLQAEPQK